MSKLINTRRINPLGQIIPALVVTVLVGTTLIASRAQAATSGQPGVEDYAHSSLTATGLRRAAESGEAAAQTRLGWLLRNGTNLQQDFTQALYWFTQAAQQGYPGAQFGLGTLYEQGRGVAKNLAEAARWYRLAADQGNAGAQNNLGWLYQNGRGVPQDYAEAARWYRQAADQGQPDAEGNLGLLYINGRGVAKDTAEGLRRLHSAAAWGDRDAATLVARYEAAPSGSPPVVQTRNPPQYAPPQTSNVLGQWRSKGPIRDEGLRRMYLVLNIDVKKVTFRYDCRFIDGSILLGSFTTRAEISSSAISILEAGVARATNGVDSCIASIQPVTLPYLLSGRELAVTFKGTVVRLKRDGPG
ncbi:MAG: tetratricopeptide repeat protein [Rhodospirillaceae bacterium]